MRHPILLAQKNYAVLIVASNMQLQRRKKH
jgi:hypothetical protein